MRILFLNDHLGYADGVWHGQTTYLVNTLPKLAASGHSVHAFFLHPRHPAASVLEAAGVRTYFAAAHPGNVWAMARLVRAALALEPDIVHTTQQASSLIGRVLKLLRPRIALVSSLIDFDTLPGPMRAMHALLPQPDVALCVSKAVRAKVLAEHRIADERGAVLYNGLDLARLVERPAAVRLRLREEWQLDAETPVITMVGRLHPEKHVDDLLRAFPAIRLSVPRAHLVIAGEGPDRGRLQRLIDTLDLAPFVTMLGFRADVPDILAASDVVAMLCPHEAFGFAALEALAMRKAVLAVNTGGLAELISNNSTGLLVPPGSTRSLVESAATLLLEPALRQRMGDRGHDYARQFSIERHVLSLERIYARHVTDPDDETVTTLHL